MKQLQIKPVLHEFKSFKEFAEEFSLTADDLILTNEYIYDPTIKAAGVPCQTIFQEKYGLGEPTDVMVGAILDEMKTRSVGRIIGVGGGTVIDIAKVMAVSDGVMGVDDMYDHMAELEQCHELFIIPTTCGTGSEVTNISIINRTKLNTKQGLVSDSMFAGNAVLIGELLQTLPYPVFATSSIDALIHATESFLSPKATFFTEMYSVSAIRDILGGYLKVVEDRSAFVGLAEQFLRASTCAGIAFGNAGCAAVHALSYALGGKYHVAHGESNYQFFVPILRLYKGKEPEGKIVKLEELLCDILGGDDGIGALEGLLQNILARKAMHEYGATEEDIIPFTKSTVANQQRLLAKNYVPLSDEEIEGIFRGCL